MPAFVLIHDREELLDALQVLLHQAFLKVADHSLEFLEADLATLVDIAGTKEFSWSHIPAGEQIDKLFNGNRFKLDVALASRARSDEVRFAL